MADLSDAELNKRAMNARVPWVEVVLLVTSCIALVLWHTMDELALFFVAVGAGVVYCGFLFWLQKCINRMSREEKLKRIKRFEQKFEG